MLIQYLKFLKYMDDRVVRQVVGQSVSVGSSPRLKNLHLVFPWLALNIQKGWGMSSCSCLE